jgi:hypothetical protein
METRVSDVSISFSVYCEAVRQVKHVTAKSRDDVSGLGIQNQDCVLFDNVPFG